MFRFTTLLVILNLTFILQASSATLYSISNGNWNNNNIWSTVSHAGPPCNCIPTSSDQVYIDHNIILNKSLINQGSDQNGVAGLLHIKSGANLNGGNFDIDIRSTGTLYLCGTLNAQNMVFTNGSTIFICSSASLNLSGSFENKNNGTNVTVHGSITVAGSFTNGNGGIISGSSGSISLTNGPMLNYGTIMGCVNNPCNSYPCSIMEGCSTILPVELIELDAVEFNNYVRINWSTASEKNNDYFLLEKSLDGINFSELSKVNGSGNSIITINYAFRDMYPASGSNYYRLKQVDFDGKSTTYDMVYVAFKANDLISIHPNPTAGKSLNININSGTNEASVIILDINGVTVYNSTRQIEDQSTKFTIDEIKNLPQGIYTLRIQSANGIQHEKLLVTN